MDAGAWTVLEATIGTQRAKLVQSMKVDEQRANERRGQRVGDLRQPIDRGAVGVDCEPTPAPDLAPGVVVQEQIESCDVAVRVPRIIRERQIRQNERCLDLLIATHPKSVASRSPEQASVLAAQPPHRVS